MLCYNEPFQHVNTVNSLLSEFHILQLPWLVIQINGNYQDINLHCILTHWILISSKYYLYYLHHDLAHKHSRFSLFYKFSANYLLHQKMHSSYTSGYKSELMLTRLCVFKIISVSQQIHQKEGQSVQMKNKKLLSALQLTYKWRQDLLSFFSSCRKILDSILDYFFYLYQQNGVEKVLGQLKPCGKLIEADAGRSFVNFVPGTTTRDDAEGSFSEHQKCR